MGINKYRENSWALLLILLMGVTSIAGGPTKSNSTKRDESSGGDFRRALNIIMARRGLEVGALCKGEDELARRILTEYGAIFLAGDAVLPPPACIFKSAEDVASFQRNAQILEWDVDGVTIELQLGAMSALLAARDEAVSVGLNISPRDGAEAGRRNYADTLRLWNSRFLPALRHWQQQGKLTRDGADRLLKLPIREQIIAVLEYESRGIYFSKDFSKSILYSVAAPGASQHLSGLAFDVNEYANEKVCRILARYGWFRTVKNDLPHFTYLGLSEAELSTYGLKRIRTQGGEFWVPNA
jgi:hypothetical protein